MVDWYKDYASKFGTVLNENPSPGNVAGGLLNITIKSLGAIAKAGTTRVEGVVGYAERAEGARPVADAGPRLRPGVDAGPGGLRRAGRRLHDRPRHDHRQRHRAGVKLASNTGVLRADVARSRSVAPAASSTAPRRSRRSARASSSTCVRVASRRGAGQGRGDQAPRVQDLGRAIGVVRLLMRPAQRACSDRDGPRSRDAPCGRRAHARRRAARRGGWRSATSNVAWPRDVLVRVRSGSAAPTSTSSSGHGNYHSDRRGRLIPLDESPQMLGHEFAGVVEEVGRDVRDLAAGRPRRASIRGATASATARPLCEYCATGDSHQCEQLRRARHHRAAGRRSPSASRVPAVNAMRVDGRARRRDRAALTEPLACIIHSCDVVERATTRYRLRHAPDADRRVRTVLIFGGGPAGLLFIAVPAQRARLRRPAARLASRTRCKRALRRVATAPTPIDPRAVDLREAVDELDRAAACEYADRRRPAPAQVFAQHAVGCSASRARSCSTATATPGVDLSVLNNVQFLEPTLISPVGASGGFEPDGRPTTYRRALGLLETGRVDVDAVRHASLSLARRGARRVCRRARGAGLRQGRRRALTT